MRRLQKAVHKKTGETVYEGAQCGDCGAIYERVPQYGEDCISVCIECRTIEGKWDMVWVAANDETVYAECDPEVEVAS